MAGRHWSRLTTSIQEIEALPLKGALVLFDVDGTLLDAGRVICNVMIQAFLAAGETPPHRDTILTTIGLSLPEMVEVLTAGLSQDRYDKILSGYRFRYFDVVEDDDTPPVFPGASEALVRLRAAGFVLGITTGKARRSTRFMLESMDWTRHFHSVQCADDHPSKPNASMVRRAQLETGRSADETILVGDSRYDMRMARNAGIPAIGVSWGYNPPVELLAEGAMAIASDFDDLLAILVSLTASEAAR